MAVSIDPSEVRNGASITPTSRKQRFRLPLRATLIGGLGGAALIAFSVGAFSFFSSLADPRARLPRIAPAAASMPDLKDGMPALVSGETVGAAPKAAALNLPRPDAAETLPAAPPVAERTAAMSAVTERPPSKTAPSETEALPLRTGAAAPPIQNAATLPDTRTAAIVAPARTAETIAPARAETVKAKPASPGSVVSLPAANPAELKPEPTATATAVAPPAPARKAVAAKPPVPKTAVRKPNPASVVANAEPAVAAAAPAPASAASDEPEIPGARQFRAGVKAIGGLFGGDGKDD